MPHLARLHALVGILVAAWLAAGMASTTEPDGGEAVDVPLEQKQRGVNWVAGHEITPLHIKPLVEANVNWIVQTPFGWQTRYDSPKITLVTGGGVLWGETDEGLRLTTEYARRHGIKTLLKPHIWLRKKPGGKWRADIDFPDEAGWREWFDQYRTFIMHYARFAQEHGIEALCIGTELRNPAVERPRDWRRLIAEIRTIYDGRLTYAANWWKEYEEITFWGDLDFIGVQGYFPLTEDETPDVDELVAGWRTHAASLRELSARQGRPILFTEQGYKSTRGAAARPWEWPNEADRAKVDLQVQANCYEAFYRVFWNESWVAGVYWWKWYPVDKVITNRDAANPDYTPQGKPAQDVLTRWYEASK